MMNNISDMMILTKVLQNTPPDCKWRNITGIQKQRNMLVNTDSWVKEPDEIQKIQNRDDELISYVCKYLDPANCIQVIQNIVYPPLDNFDEITKIIILAYIQDIHIVKAAHVGSVPGHPDLKIENFTICPYKIDNELFNRAMKLYKICQDKPNFKFNRNSDIPIDESNDTSNDKPLDIQSIISDQTNESFVMIDDINSIKSFNSFSDE
jgi:hypothetical protein